MNTDTRSDLIICQPSADVVNNRYFGKIFLKKIGSFTYPFGSIVISVFFIPTCLVYKRVKVYSLIQFFRCLQLTVFSETFESFKDKFHQNMSGFVTQSVNPRVVLKKKLTLAIKTTKNDDRIRNVYGLLQL